MDHGTHRAFWNEAMETAPRGALRELWHRELPDAVARCASTPFYRRRLGAIGAAPGDIRTYDDLAKLPFTTKDDLRESQTTSPPFGDYSTITADEAAQIFASSGSTGAPTAALASRYDLEQMADRSARAYWAMGVRPEDRVQLAFSYQLFVGSWAAHYAFQRLGAALIPMGTGDSRRQLMIMQHLRPTFWAGTPSYALYLAELAAQEGIDLRGSSVRRLFVGGEPGASIPSFRAKLEDLWHARVYDHPGQTEAVGYLGSCPEQVCHSFDDHFIWEVVDPGSGRRVGPGEVGVLVLTHLRRHGQGLLRWWTGDFTYFVEEPCACGRTTWVFPRGVFGRADDMLKVKGVRLWPSSLDEIVRAIAGAGNEFRIVLDDANSLENGSLTALDLEVEVLAGADGAAVADAVVREVKARLNLTPSVHPVPAGHLPRFEGKSRRVADRRTRRHDPTEIPR